MEAEPELEVETRALTRNELSLKLFGVDNFTQLSSEQTDELREKFAAQLQPGTKVVFHEYRNHFCLVMHRTPQFVTLQEYKTARQQAFLHVNVPAWIEVPRWDAPRDSEPRKLKLSTWFRKIDVFDPNRNYIGVTTHDT